jgi:acetyl-CoA synthetase
VAEAAAIGLPDVGAAIGYASSNRVHAVEGKCVSVANVGPIARPEHVTFVDALPKTRSGKIMRRVLKARAQGLPEGDLSTLEE